MLRKTLLQVERHGVTIEIMFPDAADHLHLDVVPAKRVLPR